MKDRTLYFNLYKEADDILIKSGIRSRCTECSNQQSHYETIDGKNEWVGNGCCHCCKHLSKTGCKIKSLSCKLWLCEERKTEWRKKLTKIRKLKRFNELISISVENNLLIFREGFCAKNERHPRMSYYAYDKKRVYVDGKNHMNYGCIKLVK